MVNQSKETELTTCIKMNCEVQEDTPGLHFTYATGEVGWVPVVKFKVKKEVASRSDTNVASKADSGSGDDDDLQDCLYEARSVFHREHDGVAGLTTRQI